MHRLRQSLLRDAAPIAAARVLSLRIISRQTPTPLSAARLMHRPPSPRTAREAGEGARNRAGMQLNSGLAHAELVQVPIDLHLYYVAGSTLSGDSRGFQHDEPTIPFPRI